MCLVAAKHQEFASTFSLSLSLLHHILVEVMAPTVPLHTLGMRLKPNPTKIPMLIFGAPSLELYQVTAPLLSPEEEAAIPDALTVMCSADGTIHLETFNG